MAKDTCAPRWNIHAIWRWRLSFAALAALEKNPLVGRHNVAQQVLGEYIQAFGQEMKLQAA